MKDKWDDPDGMIWLLERVKWLNNLDSDRRLPTHRNIWQGSYDVWFCEQDRIDAVEIPKARMKKAIDEGLIESENKTLGKYTFEIWKLTEKGKGLLGD